MFGRETISVGPQGWIETQNRMNWMGLYLEFKDTGSFSVMRADCDDTGLTVSLTADTTLQTLPGVGVLTYMTPVKLPWSLAASRALA